MTNAVQFTVNVYASFSELPDCYGQLLEEMSKVNYSASYSWFDTFKRTAMEEGAQLRLYGIESGLANPQARGLLVAQTPAARRGSILRRRHVGQCTLSGLTGYQTYLFTPLVRDSDPELDEILHSLAHYLRREKPRWELIDFAAMDRNGRVYDSMYQALRSAGYVVRRYPHFFSVFEPTRDTGFQHYLERRPYWARQRIKRYERKLRQLNRRYLFRCPLITVETELDKVLDDYESVQARSWKEPDAHPDFVPECMKACARSGCLRLIVMYLDERPVATLFAFLTGRRALFFRTAYDPDYAKESVGAIVNLEMVRHLLDEDHVEELDFGRDREPYKKCWASSDRLRYGIIAFNSVTPGGLIGLAEQSLFDARECVATALQPLRKFSAHVSQRARSWREARAKQAGDDD